MREYHENGMVKLTPEEYWTIHKHIVNRICTLPSLRALREMSPTITEIVIGELGWALLPDSEYFTDEEREEYDALMDGEQAESKAKLAEALEARKDTSNLLNQLIESLGLDPLDEDEDK